MFLHQSRESARMVVWLPISFPPSRKVRSSCGWPKPEPEQRSRQGLDSLKGSSIQHCREGRFRKCAALLPDTRLLARSCPLNNSPPFTIIAFYILTFSRNFPLYAARICRVCSTLFLITKGDMFSQYEFSTFKGPLSSLGSV